MSLWSSAPNNIQAIIDYRFESYFNVYSEPNDPTFAFNSQECEETFYGEYNVATKMGFTFSNSPNKNLYVKYN